MDRRKENEMSKYTAVTLSDDNNLDHHVFEDRKELEDWLNENGVSNHPMEEDVPGLLITEESRSMFLFRGEPIKLEERTTVRVERQKRKRKTKNDWHEEVNEN